MRTTSEQITVFGEVETGTAIISPVKVKFTLKQPVHGAETVYLPHSKGIMTNPDGSFRINLVCGIDRAAYYEVSFNDKFNHSFILKRNGGEMQNLAFLLKRPAGDNDQQSPVTPITNADFEAHTGRIATVTALGHIRIGSGLMTDANGTAQTGWISGEW